MYLTLQYEDALKFVKLRPKSASNKESIVKALRTQYGDEIEARFTPLTTEALELSIELMVNKMFRFRWTSSLMARHTYCCSCPK